MTDPLDKLTEWREITDKATEGNWVVGEHDHIQGAPHCECLPEYGPLVWEGKRDINGTIMLTHIHRRDERWWDGDTSIYSTGLPDPEVVALSTSEYVTISPENARFIATAKSEMVPALLTAVENVLNLEPESMHGNLTGNEIWEYTGWNACIEAVRDAIRDALGGAK